MEEIYKDLQLDHWEMAAANAMLLYLQHICGDEARKLMRPIVDVNMHSIEGSTAQPVQNMSTDFAEFVIRCGRWVWTLQ